FERRLGICQAALQYGSVTRLALLGSFLRIALNIEETNMCKLLVVSVFGFCSLFRVAAAFPAAKVHEVQNIELPALSGPIDHMAADVTGAKLFVAAPEDHSVEAVDLKAGRVVTRVSGLQQPHRVALIPVPSEVRRRALLSSTSGIPLGQDLIVTNKTDL